MFKKIFNAVAALSLAIVLAGGGLAGYMYGTGRLDAERIDTIAAALRGEFDAGQEQVEETPPAEETPAEPTARSADEVANLRRQEHLESLRLERAARDVAAQRQLLDQALQHVVHEQELLTDDRQRFAAARSRTFDVAEDLGFQKELEIVTTLPPKQAKEHILRVWKSQPADAVRLLVEMDASRTRRIFEQFKSEDELVIQTELLERIRTRGMEGNAG